MIPKRSFIKQHQVVLFFVLAYAFSWGNFFLSRLSPGFPFLFPFGPLLAAIIMASLTGGFAGLKDLVRRCLRWRVGISWYAAALIVPAAIGLAAVYLNALLGAPAAVQIGPWYNLLLLFPLALVDAPIGEEPGWRGYALPRFPPDRLPLANTLILGLLVVGWHLPLALSEPAITAPYLIGGIASAIMTNWVYYNARGSALLAMLYHTSANTIGIFFAPMLSGADLVRYWWLLAAVTWAAAAIVVLVFGPSLQHRLRVQVFAAPSDQPLALK